MKKIIKIIINCFVSLLIVFVSLLLIVSFFSNDDEVLKVGDYSFLSVRGESMDPVIKDGDYIVINREGKDKYKEGDIICYLHEINYSYILVTHEITKVIEDDSEIKYVTKGVNVSSNDDWYVKEDEIIGEYEGVRIPIVGHVIDYSNTSIGYLLLVVCPLGIISFICIYEFVKELDKKKGEV